MIPVNEFLVKRKKFSGDNIEVTITNKARVSDSLSRKTGVTLKGIGPTKNLHAR